MTYLNGHWDAFDQTALILRSKGGSLNKWGGKSKGLELTAAEQRQITHLFDETDVTEIESTNGDKDVLFTFARFLDNGYGFAYISDPTFLTKSNPPERYAQVVFNVTNWQHLFGNWYYVAFT